MAHPFSKMFEAALKKSTSDDNLVLEKAEELKEKGYRVEEIYEVLRTLQKSLIADADAAIVAEAVGEFGAYVEEAGEDEEE